MFSTFFWVSGFWERAGLPFGLTQGQISHIWPFLIALGLEIFGLAFCLFFGEFGLEDFSLALMLFFGFILAFSTLWYRSTTIEVTELPPTALRLSYPYHTLTV